MATTLSLHPTSTATLASVPDRELLERLAAILSDSRRVEADLISHVAEVDARRLYLGEACSSMFRYCVERLHLSEPETALRIVVARASRRHPLLLDMLRDGRLHLSGIALLAPHLTDQNSLAVLARAAFASKRQIEELVAELAPRPDAPTVIRRLPDPHPRRQTDQAQHRPDDAPHHTPPDVNTLVTPLSPGDGHHGPEPGKAAQESPATRQHRGTVEPLAPARYKFQFTAGARLKQKLERLQELLRGAVPDGDLATLIEDAVTEKIERLEARTLAAAKRPRRSVAQSDTGPGSRYVAAAVKRAVRLRDGDQCAYVAAGGRRCTERSRLQFHHRHPHGFGGDRSPANLARFCWAHNAIEAEIDFGQLRRHPEAAPRAAGTTAAAEAKAAAGTTAAAKAKVAAEMTVSGGGEGTRNEPSCN